VARPTTRSSILEGAPLKLCLGGDFDVHPSQTVKRFLLYSLGSQTNTGTLTWNASGSLRTLAINDQINSANSQTCHYMHDDLGARRLGQLRLRLESVLYL
jgi:hypothetical protein